MTIVTDRLRAALGGYAGASRGDHLLNNMDITGQPFRDAAVLILLCLDEDGEFSIVLTERTAHLRHHAGQISLPGGRVDPDDADVYAAALREAEEEIGLNPSAVTVLGRLDDYYTRSGFKIAPVVGTVACGAARFVPNPSEVAAVFTMPLAHARSEAGLRKTEREFEGILRYFYAVDYDEWYIWGATAGILKNLIEVMEACETA